MGEVIPLASTPAAPGIDLSKLQRYRMASDTKDVRNLYKDDTGTWVKIQDVERALIDASPKGGSDVQMVGEVLVTVSGFTGSGKSAVAGEIEILCKALGLDVEWVDSEEEKRLTHADWTSDLELFKPRVRIVERNIPRPPMQATSAEVSE
jgi:Mrp family chromosome partitioning ATPase